MAASRSAAQMHQAERQRRPRALSATARSTRGSNSPGSAARTPWCCAKRPLARIGTARKSLAPAATAALSFREEGAQFVSLSGAQLARLDRGEQPCALQRLLDMIASTMEPAYGFRSLLHFKAKFQPAYRPLYLAYPDPAALGSIAAAIGRAYLPHLTSRQALRLLGSSAGRSIGAVEPCR